MARAAVDAVGQHFVNNDIMTVDDRAAFVDEQLQTPDDSNDPGRPFLYLIWSDGGDTRKVSPVTLML